MHMKRFAALLLAGLLAMTVALAGCTTPATPAATTTPAAPSAAAGLSPALAEYFVSVADLKANLAGAQVIDARADKDYAAGHVKGAVNVIWQAFANVEKGKPGDKGWGTLKSAAEIAKKLGELGIDASKPIVVYTAPGGWGEDGRIVWMLRMAGINDSKCLDGGYAAWTAGGGDTSTEAPKITPTTVTIASLDQSWNATTAEVKTASAGGGAKLIDARTEKEYAGATDFGEARGGHVPTAVNVPFPNQFKDDGTLKSDADLKAMFEKAGLTTSDDVISYCTKGIRSAHMTLVLRALGYSKARNWDASYYEWAGDSSLQVVK